ncbi:peptidoglycan editing factor PgeF [Pseudomarimonas salicorniae]|uniref:Purine nucleoside phosphorylase n=1 Tax=Pseudomarimonas salicorniae TaxID=2933270 RepID=A0ABT0GFJ8_9GAMM|nr:peptidoglycan editing factor PgeF [Lysobacter sp. CAU 1642]MCK7593315.1 peptidoglycan editing factor PgeF [Lysobacter sp. CAU 1642]
MLDRQVRESVLLRADWPAPPGVVGLSTLRRGLQVGESQPPFDSFNLGDRCGDDPAAVAHNREALGWVAELPAAPRWLRQVHGDRVWRFCRGDARAEIEADAAVTADPGEVLAILTADCLPILLCAEDASEVAGIHAGWRGLAAGIVERGVEAMRAAPERLMAWIGPAAGPQRYEVGAEVREAFTAASSEAEAAFAPTRPGHWLCDLPRLARQRLAAAGVGRVYGGGHCTISDPARFYSHRRDGRSGRMATLVWIQPHD